MSTAANRFEATMARMDSVLEQRLRLQEQEIAAENAAREDVRRAKMHANAEERRLVAQAYSDAFAAFGTEVPAAVDEEPVTISFTALQQARPSFAQRP